MYTQQVLLAVLAALSVSAVPLNINLGAYSPALVVGDGEISFGGSAERASEVLQTLSAGAQNGAVPSGQTPPAPARAGGEAAAPVAEAKPAGEAALPSASVASVAPVVSAAALPETSGEASSIVSAADVSVAAAPEGDVQLPAEFISHAIASPSYPNVRKEKRSVVVAESLAMPAESQAKKVRRDAAIQQKVKRDIDGFRAALQYARDAALTAPRVELAFGITQSAGANVSPASAANNVLANGQPRPFEKREAAPEADAEAESTAADAKLGMTLIAISEI